MQDELESVKVSPFPGRPFRTVRGHRSPTNKNRLSFKMMWAKPSVLRGEWAYKRNDVYLWGFESRPPGCCLDSLLRLSR